MGWGTDETTWWIHSARAPSGPTVDRTCCMVRKIAAYARWVKSPSPSPSQSEPKNCGACSSSLMVCALRVQQPVVRLRQPTTVGGGRLLRGGGGGIDPYALIRLLTGTTALGTLVAGRGPHHLPADLLDVHAQHPGELTHVATDQATVSDAADQRRRLAQRGEPPVGPIEIVLGQDVGHHEPVQRHPPSHQLADGRVTVLQPQVAGVQPGRLDGHVGLGDEVGVPAEHLEGGGLTGRISVEGEDDLAAERVVVAHQPTQQARVVVAERRAAGGDRRVDPGHVGGHHVGVALDDHGLGLLADLLTREVQPVEHVGLLVERGLRGVQVLRPASGRRRAAGAPRSRAPVRPASRMGHRGAPEVVPAAPL